MREDSSRVRLEIAFLDADEGASAPVSPAAHDERAWRTVLVVAAESDVRRYVGECLRERTDLRLVEAATVAAAVALAGTYSPALLIVDEPEGDVVAALANLRAIVIVDDVPHDAAAAGRRIRFLARPFTAERLLAEVGELLG
jgi:DNA-binding NtrC family response regulator